MDERPVSGFILSLLGGIFMLLGTAMGLIFAPTCSLGFCYIPTYYYPFLLTATISGVAVLLGAALLYERPTHHVVWGVLILVLSATSGVGIITGYFALFGAAGLVLGIVGGSVSIAWRPGQPTAGLSGAVRLCQGCGRFIPILYPFCAYCGSPAPSIRPPSATGFDSAVVPPKP